MPRRGDEEEDCGAGQEVEFEEEMELFCDREIEEDESYGEDQAYEAFGQDV